LGTVLATFPKTVRFFPNHLVTLKVAESFVHLALQGQKVSKMQQMFDKIFKSG
jgi:hypothetical protein